MQIDDKKHINQLKHQAYSNQFYYNNKIPYCSIPRKYLNDKKLSLKAKGLLTILYSIPEEWDYSITGLIQFTGAGEKQITNIIKELIESGYIYRYEERINGKFNYKYLIFVEQTETDFGSAPYHPKGRTVKGGRTSYNI